LLGGWANVTIKAPTCALLVNVVDSVNMPIPQARVEADDLNRMSRGGSGTTNNLGTLTINLTFGKYAISVYYDDPELKLPVLLNETAIDLVKNRSFVIHCEIFDIQPSVKLFDYLGQPIPNVTVEIERKFDAEWVKIDPSIKTDSNGMAPLPNVGGDYRVSVYMSGGACETRTVSIDKTEQVVFKLNEFTLIGGYPLATSQLATIILLSLLILSFVSIVLYKRFLQKAVGEEPIS